MHFPEHIPSEHCARCIQSRQVPLLSLNQNSDAEKAQSHEGWTVKRLRLLPNLVWSRSAEAAGGWVRIRLQQHEPLPQIQSPGCCCCNLSAKFSWLSVTVWTPLPVRVLVLTQWIPRWTLLTIEWIIPAWRKYLNINKSTWVILSNRGAIWVQCLAQGRHRIKPPAFW